ncbi:hypothetical protein FEM03_13555 [Phragmitibacter flavus]|uniref:Uncharacterized protein n=1 Tax=Phragmitibacter flavus TaxID=2576071 RepID=A0A5R8KF32_9BACT|nr:Wadjet anti-phage system protein JetA family protein [Phragmitibacter flavus]TLD70209.1 hypothetical protein FEM03_13555 [Phragmitibacter flavus]
MEPLSSSLFREVRTPAFFRVLAGNNARIYVDVLDALDQECTDRPDGLSREEAVALTEEVLAHHPDFSPDEDLASHTLTDFQNLSSREKSREIIEHLTQCRWLEEPPRRDWRRRLYFDPHGATLIAALRKIAHPDAAVFTDKLLAVCTALHHETQLIDTPWQTVENCLDGTRQGLNELRAMQKSVQRLTQRQLEETTLKGNLSVVFDNYTEQIAHSCYAELVQARLSTRLPDAVRRIHDRLLDDPGTLAAMEKEVLRRHETITADLARAKVHNALNELAHLLEMVMPMADEIDRRTADFTRRSLARFRYLQEISSERRGEVRALFQQINRLINGKRFSQLSSLPDIPPFRLPETRIPNQRDSLQLPHQRRAPAEHEALDDEPTENERRAGLADMERSLRDSLSVRRANEFIQNLPGGKGSTHSSADLSFPTRDSAATDLLAILLHAESPEARYRLEASRLDESHAETEFEYDPFPGGKVERFTLIKKS